MLRVSIRFANGRVPRIAPRVIANGGPPVFGQEATAVLTLQVIPFRMLVPAAKPKSVP